MSRSDIARGEMPPFSGIRSVLALMIREMGSTYGDSPGGYIWAVVQPIGMIIVLSLGFSLIVRTPSLGTSFVLFYATGFLSYDIYKQMMSKITVALTYSKPMLAYPRVTWLDAIIARAVLNMVTLAMVFCVVITGVLMVIETRTVIEIQPIIIGLAMAACLGVGVGMINCLLGGLFPVWIIIWKIITRPMFIASGVIFIYEDMPPAAQNILWWNPVMHVTGIVRTGFYPSYEASYASLEYGFGLGLGLIMIGLLFLRAYYEKILNR